MPALPVISNVFRCAFEFSGGIVNPVTVLHFKCTDSSDVTAIAARLGAARVASGHNPWLAMHEDYLTNSVLITPLDGSTAGTAQALGSDVGGAQSGDQILNDACLVSFHTARRGSRGRGRAYIGPIVEGIQAGGLLTGTVEADTLTAWAAWHAALESGTPSITPVIASYVHADEHTITSLRVNTKVASQRRRLDRR
jgi:hypothetical protein